MLSVKQHHNIGSSSLRQSLMKYVNVTADLGIYLRNEIIKKNYLTKINYGLPYHWTLGTPLITPYLYLPMGVVGGD